MTNKNDWLLKKNLRSVDNLRLWGQNPRLDPENSYITTRDFAEEITSSEADRNSFIDIAKSIVNRGFIPADPIVVWQNEENQKFYVVEGNRRVLAIKLLHQPEKAPKSIRGIFTKLASNISKDDLIKIPVSIAPTFDDAEWYISQRHSTSSLQKRWSTEQQKRWVADLYDKYNGNIDIIKTKIDITESELQGIIRILKLKSFVRDIKNDLSDTEYKQATSHTFPLTTLDRFFNFTNVRDTWGIKFDAYEVIVDADKASFLKAFADLIKRILLPRGNDNRIDSRIIRTSEDAEKILQSLPIVDKTQSEEKEGSDKPEDTSGNNQNDNENNSSEDSDDNSETEVDRRNKLKNNPNRPRLVCDFYSLQTDSHKLSSLFEELKLIPLKYQNAIAASIRIFLDLSVLKYIETENLEKDIRKKYNTSLRDVNLKKRLEFLKNKISNAKATNIISRLLNSSNEFSLDVLNGYVHNQDTHYLSIQFLNGFWDFLFPLFQKLVVIKEDK